MDIFVGFMVAIAFAGLGNCLADQATLRECATKGRAELMGGGTVICSVERKSAGARAEGDATHG